MPTFTKTTNESFVKVLLFRLIQFCQPSGWISTLRKRPPSFFVAILTDVEGKASYLACLTFHETVQQQTKLVNGVTDQKDALQAAEGVEKTYEIFHTPTCLCIVSRLKHFTTLKVGYNFLFIYHCFGVNERKCIPFEMVVNESAKRIHVVQFVVQFVVVEDLRGLCVVFNYHKILITSRVCQHCIVLYCTVMDGATYLGMFALDYQI